MTFIHSATRESHVFRPSCQRFSRRTSRRKKGARRVPGVGRVRRLRQPRVEDDARAGAPVAPEVVGGGDVEDVRAIEGGEKVLVAVGARRSRERVREKAPEALGELSLDEELEPVRRPVVRASIAWTVAVVSAPSAPWPAAAAAIGAEVPGVKRGHACSRARSPPGSPGSVSVGKVPGRHPSGVGCITPSASLMLKKPLWKTVAVAVVALPSSHSTPALSCTAVCRPPFKPAGLKPGHRDGERRRLMRDPQCPEEMRSARHRHARGEARVDGDGGRALRAEEVEARAGRHLETALDREHGVGATPAAMSVLEGK